MNSWLRALFSVTYPYEGILRRQRARSLLIVVWSTLIGWALYVFGVALPNIAEGGNQSAFLNGGFAIVPFAAIFSLWALQRGRLQLAALLTVGGLASATIPLLFSSPDGQLPLGVLIPLVAGGVMLQRRQFALVVLIVIGALILRALSLANVTTPYQYIPANNVDILILVPLVTFGTASLFMFAFSGNAERVTGIAVDEARYMRVVAEQGAQFDDIQDENVILDRFTKTLQSEFAFFSVQIYMKDEHGQLIRRIRAAMGIVETRSADMLRASPRSLAALALAEGDVVVADRNAPPERYGLVATPARKAITIPLKTEDEVFGVVEALSDLYQPFTAAQVDALRLLGQQTARSIAVSRRLTDLEITTSETQTNLMHLAAQLRVQETVSARTAKTDWESYLQKRGNVVGFDLELNGNEKLMRAEEMSDDLRTAMLHGDIFVEEREGMQALNIPLFIRGELFGAMSFALPPDHKPTQRQIELARNVAERLGAALESSRLFEQSRAQAERERQASETTNLLLGVTDVQTVLDLAAADFQKALGAVYTRVYLDVGPEGEKRATREETETS